MLARLRSFAVVGLEAVPVEIEVDSGQGLPGLTIVGLPDQAVKEARERVRSAIRNSQFQFPDSRITVNLAPADVKKEGGSFDLAIALGVLACSDQLDPAALGGIIAVGELALDGTLRPTPGILPIVMAARTRRSMTILVPSANTSEAAVVKEISVVPVKSLREAVEHLAGTVPVAMASNSSFLLKSRVNRYAVDFADVKGQLVAKRALEIAAAGAHHVLMIGPPGSGKSMLAQRLPTIQPDLTVEEALETTAIHSVMNLLSSRQPLITQRPFRAPHHTSSAVSLIGGGPAPRPGEISLAHHGVLFLDELPEFHRDVLESLRQPLEDGRVSVARAKRAVVFPSRFTLVAAMNPCPCGHLTDSRRRCRCTHAHIQRYLAKISGPLLDRIDLHIDVPAVPFDTLSHRAEGESSVSIKSRVVKARALQRRRLKPHGLFANAQMRHREIQKLCVITDEARTLLKTAMEELSLSARSYDKILKIARTIADLAQADRLSSAGTPVAHPPPGGSRARSHDLIQTEHLAEAIQYRSLDRRLWV